MNTDFLDKLDTLRGVCGFAFHITSGYRSVDHSVEVAKEKPGTHTQGIAADIVISGGSRRFILVNNAVRMGFTGVGIAKGFVHLDTRSEPAMMWSY